MTATETSLEAKLDELLAKEAIRDALYTYSRAVDRGDEELLKSCYHPDAVDAHWTFIGNAHEFASAILKDHLMGYLKPTTYRHHMTNILIELDGDRAFVETMFIFSTEIPLADGTLADRNTEGRYLDVFERRDGTWRILERLLVPEKDVWSQRIKAVPKQSDDPLPLPDETQRPGHYPHDPVYRKFDLHSIMPAPYRSDRNRWIEQLTARFGHAIGS